jgi:hypothetical protein
MTVVAHPNAGGSHTVTRRDRRELLALVEIARGCGVRCGVLIGETADGAIHIIQSPSVNYSALKDRASSFNGRCPT